MSVITEADIKKQIKSGEFDRLYLIYGEEDYLKRFYVGKIAEKSVDKSFADFNLHSFEGKGIDLDALSDAVEAYPMMGGYSCTVVHDLPADTLSKEEVQKLAEIYSDLPDSSVLVLWMDHIEASPKKSAKWKSFINDVGAHGALLEMNKRSRNELIKLVCSGAQRRDCSITPQRAEYLISLVGDDMHNLLSELEKVCAFIGSGEITAEAIEASAVKTVEAAVFDLTKAIAADSSGRAFEILNTLFVQRTEPTMILGALISSYVDMYRVKICRQSGGRAEDVGKHFDYRNKEFRLRNASGQGAKMTAEQLRKSLDALNEADTLLKGSDIDGKLLLEQCVTKLLLQRAASL